MDFEIVFVANVFRFSYAKLNKCNAVRGHRTSSQGGIKRFSRDVIDFDKGVPILLIQCIDSKLINSRLVGNNLINLG